MCTVHSRPMLCGMAVDDAMPSLVASLEWPGAWADADASEPGDGAVRDVLSPGANRWVHGAVQSALDMLRVRDDADRLAPVPQVRALAEHVLGSVLLRLASPADAAADRTVDRVIAHDIVSRDIGLPSVIEAMRTFQNRWIALLVDHAMSRSGGAALVPELARVSIETVDAWVDAFIEAVLAERERALQSQQARTRGLVEAIVAGRAYDEAAAPRLLGRPLDGWHLGCVVDAPPGAIIEPAAVDAVVGAFGRTVGTASPLRYDTSTGRVWLWIGADRRFVAPTVDDLRVPAPLVVGIGDVHPGAAGFRRTHLEAADALTARPREARGAAYPDVALTTLLCADTERARWFVDLELGELGADAADMADLRETLRTFFATRMRIAPAAELLFVHRNTLISRLERIERLLGRSVAEHTVRTQAALLVHEVLSAQNSQPAPSFAGPER